MRQLKSNVQSLPYKQLHMHTCMARQGQRDNLTGIKIVLVFPERFVFQGSATSAVQKMTWAEMLFRRESNPTFLGTIAHQKTPVYR